jgi:hypothetical protein
MVARTGDEVDDPRMEEEAVGDPRVLRLPPVHGATGAPIHVHLAAGLLLQQRQRCVALTAGHLDSLSLSLTRLAQVQLAHCPVEVEPGRLESSDRICQRRCVSFWLGLDRDGMVGQMPKVKSFLTSSRSYGSCGGWNLWLVISLTE